MYNIKNNQNNKKGGSVCAGGSSQDREKDKKKKKKNNGKKNVVGPGFEPTTLRLQILHLTRWAKIAKCHNSGKIYRFFSKVD